MIRNFLIVALVTALLTPLAPRPAIAAELLYFRSDACSYCEQWEDEVGGVYPLTEEAGEMALRSIDIEDTVPDDVSFVKGVVYTPTFVAVENGREIGRIVGYGGDDFFWQQMSMLMDTLKNVRATASGCPDGDARPRLEARAGGSGAGAC